MQQFPIIVTGYSIEYIMTPLMTIKKFLYCLTKVLIAIAADKPTSTANIPTYQWRVCPLSKGFRQTLDNSLLFALEVHVRTHYWSVQVNVILVVGFCELSHYFLFLEIWDNLYFVQSVYDLYKWNRLVESLCAKMGYKKHHRSELPWVCWNPLESWQTLHW